MGFTESSVARNPSANVRDTRDEGSIPGSGRSPGGGNINPLQCSCLGNPMKRGAWQATVHRLAESRTWLSMHANIEVHFFSMVALGIRAQPFLVNLPLPITLQSHSPKWRDFLSLCFYLWVYLVPNRETNNQTEKQIQETTRNPTIYSQWFPKFSFQNVLSSSLFFPLRWNDNAMLGNAG